MDVATAHHHGTELVGTHTARFVEYLRGLDDAALATPIASGDWNVGEVIAHVRTVLDRYTGDQRRADSPAGVGRQNGEDLERVGVDAAAHATAIEAHAAALVGLSQFIEPERLFPFHAGQQVTFAGGLGNLLGELLAHGDDIARATGRPFTMPGEDLEVLWRFSAPAMSGWVRPECRTLAETWDLQFPFGMLRLTLDHGTVLVADAPVGVRPSLRVDDVAEATLAFPYRRRAITEPAMALLASRFYDL